MVILTHACGITINFEEIFRNEKSSDIIDLISQTIAITKKKIDYIIYDDACHLAEATKSKNIKFKGTDLMKFYIDRFHQYNHVREKCKNDHNIENYPELTKLIQKSASRHLH